MLRCSAELPCAFYQLTVSYGEILSASHGPKSSSRCDKNKVCAFELGFFAFGTSTAYMEQAGTMTRQQQRQESPCMTPLNSYTKGTTSPWSQARRSNGGIHAQVGVLHGVHACLTGTDVTSYTCMQPLAPLPLQDLKFVVHALYRKPGSPCSWLTREYEFAGPSVEQVRIRGWA